MRLLFLFLYGYLLFLFDIISYIFLFIIIYYYFYLLLFFIYFNFYLELLLETKKLEMKTAAPKFKMPAVPVVEMHKQKNKLLSFAESSNGKNYKKTTNNITKNHLLNEGKKQRRKKLYKSQGFSND